MSISSTALSDHEIRSPTTRRARLLEGYLSEADLAAELKKSQRTVQLWRQQRKGPPWTTIGKSIFYSQDGVHAWLKEREQQPVRTRRARTSAQQSAA